MAASSQSNEVITDAKASEDEKENKQDISELKYFEIVNEENTRYSKYACILTCTQCMHMCT